MCTPVTLAPVSLALAVMLGAAAPVVPDAARHPPAPATRPLAAPAPAEPGCELRPASPQACSIDLDALGAD